MAAASESESLWCAGLVRLRNTCHDFAVEKSDDNGGLRLAAASESLVCGTQKGEGFLRLRILSFSFS